MVSGETQLVGDLSLSDNLHVDGSIKGTVKSAADVTLGKTGCFEGDLNAVNILVSGRFQGNISAQRLEIIAGGYVEGEVEVDELIIESGGHFNGSSRTRSTDNPRRISHDSAENAPGSISEDNREEVVDVEPEQLSEKENLQNSRSAL